MKWCFELARRLRYLPKDRSGVAALEFALVGTPFLLVMLFLMNIGLQTYVQSALDQATVKAGHQIQSGWGMTASGTVIGKNRTGPQGSGPLSVQTLVCSYLPVPNQACLDGLKVYANTGTTFHDLARVDSAAGGLSSAGVAFNTLGSAAPVILQVAYLRTSVTSFTEPWVISTYVFENEQ